jgi:feruloyl-CoA synthase
VRVRLIAAGNPIIQDAVITGHGRHDIGAMVFLSAAAQSMSTNEIRAKLEETLRSLAADGTGSSLNPKRLLVLDEPPSIDAGEITDKGYINQRAVLERRAVLVEQLHAEGTDVIQM